MSNNNSKLDDQGSLGKGFKETGADGTSLRALVSDEVDPIHGECPEFSADVGNTLLHDGWDPTDGLHR